MRAQALVLTLLLTFGAGCSGTDDDQAPMDEAPVVPATNGTLPAPIHETGEFLMAADPSNVATGVICTGPSVDPPCYYYDFHTDVNVSLEATLVWTNPANDLDLYLYEGDTLVSSDGINTIGNVPPDLPATQQVMHAEVPPGDYQFYVVAWNGAAESYTLDATFS